MTTVILSLLTLMIHHLFLIIDYSFATIGYPIIINLIGSNLIFLVNNQALIWYCWIIT